MGCHCLLRKCDLSCKHSGGFPGGASGKEFPCQCRRCMRCRFHPWFGKIPWSSKWQATPAFCPRKSHGQKSLLGYSPLGHKESNNTEQWSSSSGRRFSDDLYNIEGVHLYFCFLNHELVFNSVRCFCASVDISMCLFF